MNKQGAKEPPAQGPVVTDPAGSNTESQPGAAGGAPPTGEKQPLPVQKEEKSDPDADLQLMDLLGAQPWSRVKTARNEEKKLVKGESDEAWQAFVLYRNMPHRAKEAAPRSLAKVAAELSKSIQLVYRWSTRWNWVDRAAAFDDYIDKKTVEEDVWRLKESKKRIARQAKAISQKGYVTLLNMPQGDIPPHVALAMMKEGSTLERLALGESTENVRQTVDGEIREIVVPGPVPKVVEDKK